MNREEERYNQGFFDGYKKATQQDNLVIEDIKAEIRQTVDEEADDERWSRGLHYSLCIIDKHIKGERRSE